MLRLEYRSKLLNPRWAKAMAAQGSGGAYEISQRMTAMVSLHGLAWAGVVHVEFRRKRREHAVHGRQGRVSCSIRGTVGQVCFKSA